MKKHLLMHLWPIVGSTWRLCLDELIPRWSLFNGRKMIAVVSSGDPRPSVPLLEVQSYLPPDAEFLHVPNDPGLREVSTWGPMIEALSGESGEDGVFYCQGKGVTHPRCSMVHQWGGLMYASLLDYWSMVSGALTRHPIVGSFKKVGYGFGAAWGNWHYSGSFYWSTLATLRTRLQKTPMHMIWHGVESWPGAAFTHQEAGCIFHQATVERMDLYAPRYWDETVWPQWHQFVSRNRHLRQAV